MQEQSSENSRCCPDLCCEQLSNDSNHPYPIVVRSTHWHVAINSVNKAEARLRMGIHCLVTCSVQKEWQSSVETTLPLAGPFAQMPLRQKPNLKVVQGTEFSLLPMYSRKFIFSYFRLPLVNYHSHALCWQLKQNQCHQAKSRRSRLVPSTLKPMRTSLMASTNGWILLVVVFL